MVRLWAGLAACLVAQMGANRTFIHMSDGRESTAALLQTPWCLSWFDQCRPGDRYDHDATRRAQAWAAWTVGKVERFTGVRERSYLAVVLEGKFHDPNGRGPVLRPHLEIPERLLSRADHEFPDRIAQLGNGIGFPWWVLDEVTATRRVLFPHPHGAVGDLVEALARRRGALADAVEAHKAALSSSWGKIQELLVSDPGTVSELAASGFDRSEVAEFLPAVAPFALQVAFDQKLKETAGRWASRRVGVWQLGGLDTHNVPFALGVLTPRLTSNSQFNDEHFSTATESVAALLVRGLVLRRIGRELLGGHVGTVADGEDNPDGVYFRSVVAKVGGKLPEAGERAAVQFLQSYPDPDRAWAALATWAHENGTILTAQADAFATAHRRAMRFVRRAENPERDDINVLLPLGWDGDSRLVRVTFARRSTNGDD